MYEKLIRDLIPQLARAEGRELRLRTASAAELGPLLSRKLVEEAVEVGDAQASGERDALVGELADLYTALAAVAERHGIGLDEVQEAARRKHLARGGFGAGLVLAEDGPGRGGCTSAAAPRSWTRCATSCSTARPRAWPWPS